MKNDYHKLLEKHRLTERKLRKRNQMLGTIRMLVSIAFFAMLWLCIETYSNWMIVGMALAVVAFIVLLKIHEKARYKLSLTKALIQINEDEIQFVDTGKAPFFDGAEFLPLHHAYAHDLDIFGTGSVYQHLNRTSTFMGKKKLVELLLNRLPFEKIGSQQEAVKELSSKTEFRQQVQAIGMLVNDSPLVWQRLKSWSESVSDGLSRTIRLSSFALPVLLGTAIVVFALSGNILFRHVSIGLFLVNLYVLQSQLKKIKHEMAGADKVDDIIRNYSQIAAFIESESFASATMQNLQCCPNEHKKAVSTQLKKLSGHFRDLETITNLLAAVIFNGFFLYHLHVLHSLLKWKRQHAHQLLSWLETIGETEAIGCLANFAANNPEYAYPAIVQKPEFSFAQLGHPLISSKKRVCNDVSFDAFRFAILTGSNMSGKSTFLRTLGVNLVLGSTGSPICASSAQISPVEVLTSIHQSDSLNENESYFFAEVKRLKEIMDAASGKTVFILLDEILRGTNSDDKRNGTLEVIKKLATQNCYGVVATHDLEICNLASEYEGVLSNKCFEVEIVDNDLYFDFKLREGVCRNKSATFLMKKMGII